MTVANKLTRQIGLRTAIALVVGEIIAVGIFLVPAGMAKALGSPFWLLIVWLVMGGMALCGALCYGELAAKYPEAGGGYVYLREAYGRPVAFLYGWMALLVMDPGLTAALAVGGSGYASYILNLSPREAKVLAILIIFALAAVNIFGVGLGARVLRWLTVLKLALIAFLLVWGFGMQLGSWSNFAPFVAQRAGSAPLFEGLVAGLGSAFFAFGGWWDVTKVAAEIRDPTRNLPRALTYGVLIVSVVYILITAVFLYLVPLSSVTSAETFAAQAGEVLFGSAGAKLFSGFVIISVLGSLAALVMSAPRVYFAMAKDGLFASAIAEVHPRFGTPARAVALQAIVASILVTLGNFKQIVSYFVFVIVIFIGLTVAALFVLRRKGEGKSGFRTPGYPFTPIFFLVLTAGMLLLMVTASPKESLLGVGVVALGIPIYYFYVRLRTAI